VSRRHKRHEEHDEHPSEAWLIALADMMTLLMVTFLMMFAISSLDLKKFQTFKEAFAKGTGTSLPALPGEGVPTVGETTDVAKAPTDASAVPVADAYTATTGGKVLDAKALEELRKKIAAQLDKAGLSDMVEAKIDGRGLVLYVTSAVLFDSGEAEVTTHGRAMLDALGPVLRGVGNHLVVEGHTDSRPISSTRFSSNWELSAMRATAVARQLMDVGHIPSSRVNIAGYADTRPRENARTDSAYARNRRVEIVVEAVPVPARKATAVKKAPVAVTAPKKAAASSGH
jgi:chemotaxis protein MotB